MSRPPLFPGRRDSPQGGAAGREGNARGGDWFGRGGPGGRAIDGVPLPAGVYGAGTTSSDWEMVEKHDDDWELVKKDGDPYWNALWGQRVINSTPLSTESAVLGLLVYMEYEAGQSWKNSEGKRWLEQWIHQHYPLAFAVVNRSLKFDPWEKETYRLTTKALQEYWPSPEVSSIIERNARLCSLSVRARELKAKTGSPSQYYAMELGAHILLCAEGEFPHQVHSPPLHQSYRQSGLNSNARLDDLARAVIGLISFLESSTVPHERRTPGIRWLEVWLERWLVASFGRHFSISLQRIALQVDDHATSAYVRITAVLREHWSAKTASGRERGVSALKSMAVQLKGLSKRGASQMDVFANMLGYHILTDSVAAFPPAN